MDNQLYAQMLRAYYAVANGSNIRCSQIVCGPAAMATILELMMPMTSPNSESRLQCSYCRSIDQGLNCRNCGAPLADGQLPRTGPVRFMGAEVVYGNVVYGDVAWNEMRFIGPHPQSIMV